MEDSSGLSCDVDELQVVIEDSEASLTTLQEKMAQENTKIERYKVRGGREREVLCVCEGGREGKIVCLCVCVRACVRVCVCVCVKV